MNAQDVSARLEATRTEEEWNDVCDEVKAANGGGYPGDWWDVVLASGLAGRKQAEFTQERYGVRSAP